MGLYISGYLDGHETEFVGIYGRKTPFTEWILSTCERGVGNFSEQLVRMSAVS